MPYKNAAITVCVVAWDTANNIGKTGDAGNITVRGVGDGTEYTPSSPSITEMDSVNLPGVYKVSLTAAENNYSMVLLGGKSSTTGVVIQPVQWTNESSVDPVAILDFANSIETGLTLRQAMRLLTSAEAGKISGASTGTITIRNAVADSKNRIVAAVDSNGNRTSLVYDLTT